MVPNPRPIDDVLARAGAARDAAAGSPVHSERTASWLGLALGVSFSVCFLTGLLSHLIQVPPAWFTWTSRPAGLYRVTQGVHVATGIASIPLLLAKLWSVHHHLVAWPPARSTADVLERISLVPLVGGSLFLLMSGWQNINLWYPWPVFFPRAHYWVAWVTVGALLTHVAAKVPVMRRVLGSGARDVSPPALGTLSRRGYLALVGGAAAALTLTTVGQTVGPLRHLAFFAPRRPDRGPQGVPVNRAATEAGVVDRAMASSYRLDVEGAVTRPLSLTLADLQGLVQREATLPISCVEGWSATGRWRGVAVPDLLALAGVDERRDVEVEVHSLEEGGAYSRSVLNRWHARDRDTLLALDLGGEPLHLDHGFPLRLIGPNRPGVHQTKWVTRLVVR